MTDYISEYTGEEIDAGIAKANMVYNALPKVTDEGDSLTLDGTANCPMKMELKGNTEQTTYSGKNLYKSNESYSFTQGTASWTFVDGTRGANGSDTGDKTTLKAQVSNGTTYTFKVGNLITTATSIQLVYGNETLITSFSTTNIKDGYTFTSNRDGVVLLRIFVPANDNVSISQIQLEEGSTATPYEPYVGGTPAPTPDYPQDVRVVTGNNSVKVIGKNLFDTTKYSSTANVTILDKNNGVLDLEGVSGYYEGVSQAFNVIPNQSYVLSYNAQLIDTSVASACYVRIREKDDTTVIATNYNSGNQTISFTPTTDEINVFFRVNGETNRGHSKYSNIQLEKDSATTYEPYQSQTYPINLGTIELCKIGTYQDYIYKSNGKWYKHSEIGKVVLDGSENWDYQSQFPRFRLSNLSPRPVNTSDLFCTHYKLGQTSDTNNTISLPSGTGYSQVLIHDERFTTKETFNSWLQSNNVTIYYRLETPTNTEITDTTLISQLNAIENAVSYDTQTNIEQENYSEPFIINAECVRSLKDIFELISNS